MSNLPISSKYVSSPAKAVDAAERDAVVDRVNAAFEAGEIDDLDYRHFLDLAFAAQTLGDLRPVVERLPAVATYATPRNIEVARSTPGELSASRPPSSRVILIALSTLTAAAVIVVAVLSLILH